MAVHGLEYVSLFSGAGGLDLGFEMAGWRCLYASDIDKDAVSTLEANRNVEVCGHRVFQETVIRREDVRNVTGDDILRSINRKRGQVPLLLGGPPCQSWSSAGHQRGFDDPRGQLFGDFVRIAGELDVRWIVFENVRGLLTARGPDGVPGSALEYIRSKLLRAGYQTSVDLLNAADFGVPQRRVRLIMMGFRPGDVAPTFPQPTHQRGNNVGGNYLSWVTMGECLSTLAPVREEEIVRPSAVLAAQLALLSPGSGVKSQGKKEATRPGGHWGYKQGAFLADKALPARTVTANSQQDWVKDHFGGIRRLSTRECAALQSFPPEWSFTGTRGSAYRLIGNAVPPRLATALAQSLKRLALVERPPVHAAGDHELIPLHPSLRAAIRYTFKEQIRNGPSRLAAPPKRKSRVSSARH